MLSRVGYIVLAESFSKLSKQEKVARVTGLEPATSGVTGRHSNQLSYNRTFYHYTFKLLVLSIVKKKILKINKHMLKLKSNNFSKMVCYKTL